MNPTSTAVYFSIDVNQYENLSESAPGRNGNQGHALSTLITRVTCLTIRPDLNMESVVRYGNQYLVLPTEPSDCVDAVFTRTVAA